MIYTVHYIGRVSKEYFDALNWYGTQSIEASINFSISFKDCVTKILKEPDRYRKAYKEFREISLKKFPFTVIYSIDEENKAILVVSLFHKRRNPKLKYRNLK